MFMVFGSLAPVLHEILRSIVSPGGNFLVFTVIAQTFVFPAIIALTFAIVTPMFWYGSVLLRFAVAALLVLPGAIAFLLSAMVAGAPGGFWATYTTVLMSMFLLGGIVTVLVQMGSWWTLSHSRPVDTPTIPTGTRSIMELTCVTAVGCAIVIQIDTPDITEMLLGYLAVGLCASLAALSTLIGYLRVQRRNLIAASLSALFAFCTAFTYTGLIAYTHYGWDKLPTMLVALTGVSIYGMLCCVCVMWFCISWLRSYGWICLSRQDAQQMRQSPPNDPWRFWFRGS